MTDKQAGKQDFSEVELSKIDEPGYVARMDIVGERIEELAKSIEAQGLLQPILVTRKGERFEIIAGHRRYLAHKYLGRNKITCKIVDADERETALARASENLLREDLTLLEEAMTYVDLRNRFDLTFDKIGKMTGKSAAVVKRRMEILNMPPSFRKALHGGSISMSVAEELVSCPDEGYREYLLEMAVDHGITMRVARQWVEDWKKSQRRQDGDALSAGSLVAPSPTQKIYHSCDLCQEPVEISLLKEIRMCPDCFKAILAVVTN